MIFGEQITILELFSKFLETKIDEIRLIPYVNDKVRGKIPSDTQVSLISSILKKVKANKLQ